MRPRLLAAIAFVLTATACGGGAATRAPLGSESPEAALEEIQLARSSLDRAPGTDADAEAAAEAVNSFGLDLYRLIAAQSEDNLVVSPASIALALGMARAGAAGDTADEMDAVLHGVASPENPNLLNSLDQALAARSGTFTDWQDDEGDVSLRIANAAFAQHGFPLEEAYLDALAARFGSGVQLVDYRSDPEAARRLINEWVATQTEERIPELLQPGTIDRLTRLVLTNAIYLKAQWYAPFDEQATRDAPFVTASGETVSVPMMVNQFDVRYAAGYGWQAVEIPYVGEQLAMTVIVPDDLASFEADLDAATFSGIFSAMGERYVNLLLPRFRAETHVSVRDALMALGMTAAFDPRLADFSGITPESEGLVISDVVHQANIDVDEEGTEAAAATAVIIGFTSGGPPDAVTLTVDRPFVFALRDTQTGAVLFLGRITDPSAPGS